MPPKKSNVKADRAKKDKIVEDKTFGLKNKKKSKTVQKYIQQVTKNVKGDSMDQSERLKQEKKNAKLAKMQADEELRALFGEALDKSKKTLGANKKAAAKEQAAALKKDDGADSKAKLMKDYPFIADEMLAATGMLNDLSPEELDKELAHFTKTGKSDVLTLEQVIELQRAKMRADGAAGTPVTEESLAAWKARRAEKRRLEATAKVEAELRKKKGGKGLSVLSGKELFAYNQSLFVDDEDADVEQYERTSDAEDEEDDGDETKGGAGGVAAAGGGQASRAAAVDSDSDSEDEPPVKAQNVAGEQVAVALQESLYLEGSDDDLDDLDDLDDD